MDIMEAATKEDHKPSDFDKDFDKEWPGLKFHAGDEEFLALLRTAHRSAVGYLLFDHPDVFPGKNIESITIFSEEVDMDMLSDSERERKPYGS